LEHPAKSIREKQTGTMNLNALISHLFIGLITWAPKWLVGSIEKTGAN
jgi:hypothetical protein